jgi:hypothetical protein
MKYKILLAYSTQFGQVVDYRSHKSGFGLRLLLNVTIRKLFLLPEILKLLNLFTRFVGMCNTTVDCNILPVTVTFCTLV